MTKISLALQGGGAHGAFTWGVLDRLLEDGNLEVAAISGTSAGALNGAALKAGLVEGGNEAARKRLRALWEHIADIGDFRQLLPWFQPFLPAFRFWQDAASSLLPFSPQGVASQLYSPYDFGQNWVNPLDVVVRELDFSKICTPEGPQLFIGATNVRTGKVHIFKGDKITSDAILASACLPAVFQAVEIEGEAYWDGGYAGNPSLWPLYDQSLPDDILIVQVNPLRREDIPKSALDIQNRVNEIGFNTPLLSELRAIAFVRRLIGEGRLDRGQMKDLRIHMIADDELMNELSAGSKMQPSAQLIGRLHDAGRTAADAFMTGNRVKLGKESSVDILKVYG